MLRLMLMIASSIVAAGAADAAEPLSFRYEDGRPSEAAAAVHTHTASVPEAKGRVHVYASLGMGDANPVAHVNGLPQALQDIAIGEGADGKFNPALRFGLGNRDRGSSGQAQITPWAFDGRLDYYGMHARPKTPCDFRLELDLPTGRATVWASGRGDDGWFMLAENVPLIHPVSAINEIRVEQHPGAQGIHDVVVRTTPWPAGEAVRPHPLAKKERVVGPDRGFKLQSLRSVWRKPGRHVTIARKPPVWVGFPDVVQTGLQALVCAHNDGVGHGGGGKLLVRHSGDLGQTWGEPTTVHPSGINCPRLQKLRDGTLLLLADVGGVSPVLYDSADGGKTWSNPRSCEPAKAGGNQACVPSRVLELPDGAWLLAGSWYPGGKPFEGTEGERLEFYRSTDRGATWKLLSFLQAYPPHSLSEASLLSLPDGRLVLFAREARYDGFPGVKAFSRDNGKTWGPVEELPFAITGRTCAGFLRDGRVLLTFRSGIGRSALWAWLSDPDDKTGFRPAGVHFNDTHSIGLKDGALHIDNDGHCGEFTQYFLRPPDSPETVLDVTVEAKILANAGHAATLCVPFVGKFRLFTDRVELAHEPSARAETRPGEFHAYRVVSQGGRAKLYVDGKLALETDKADRRARHSDWTPAHVSLYPLAFGNERATESSSTNLYAQDIPTTVTGYSIWRRAAAVLDDPKGGRRAVSWSADRDGFPDQYQLDNIIEIDASIAGHDQGYSGWIELADGRIFVVNYTDDTAPSCPPSGGGVMGVSWIRGTYVLPSDLPQRGTAKGASR